MNFFASYKTWTVLMLVYVLVWGLIGEVPRLNILNETIRNLHFHVPMWFGMIVFFSSSVYYSVDYLRNQNLQSDLKATRFASTGIVYGLLGLLTGMIWAQYTWGSAWSNDPKQTASAIALLIYLAFFVLRSSFESPSKKATVSSVYSIFAYPSLILLIFILPRLSDSSLHPGAQGNPAFNAYDLDSKLRLVFYPAVLGWIGLGWWITELWIRFETQKKIRES
jgi:heme exporter protein C